MMRKMALESSTFGFDQKLGNKHFIVEDLKKKLQNWDTAVSKKFIILVLLYVEQVNSGLKEQKKIRALI